jgi:hypothetical protein
MDNQPTPSRPPDYPHFSSLALSKYWSALPWGDHLPQADRLQPHSSFVEFLERYPEFVNEVVGAFCAASFSVVRSTSGARAEQLFPSLPPSECPWESIAEFHNAHRNICVARMNRLHHPQIRKRTAVVAITDMGINALGLRTTMKSANNTLRTLATTRMPLTR